MKKRLISVAVGLALLAAVLFWYDTPLVNALFAIIGALCLYEAQRALGFGDHFAMTVSLCGIHILNMFTDIDERYIIALAMFAVFSILIMGKEHIEYKNAAALFGVFIMVTVGLDSALATRAMTPFVNDARFMFFIALALGWICDTFAFTFGKLFGKKKLCPEVSPNKTIAGAVGGIIGTPVFVVAAFYLFTNSGGVSSFAGMFEPEHIVFYAAMGFIGSVVGIIGDLAASYIKRECGIKDFGNLMPGHGGALDRMDSVLFTCAFAGFAFDLFFDLFIVF